MKKIFLITLLFALSLSACQENERMVYEDKDGLYFLGETDSLTYSFTMVKDDYDTLNLNVQLLGNVANVDRKFKIKLNETTTAKAGTHFKALESEYILPKNQIHAIIPIYIYKTADLDDNTFSIDLSVVEDNNFTIGYRDKNRMRFFVTNQLVKPSYWDDLLYLYFGDYSKVKHQVCVDLMGHDFPMTDSDLDYSYYMKAGRKAALHFALNNVNDEQGRRIETWDPF